MKLITIIRKLSRLLILAIVSFIGFGVLYSSADTIYLKNGQALEGILLSEDNNQIICELSIGSMTIKKDKVKTKQNAYFNVWMGIPTNEQRGVRRSVPRYC